MFLLSLERKKFNSYTIDHLLPVKRAGTNDLDNLVPACIKCNRRKYIMTGHEFFLRKIIPNLLIEVSRSGNRLDPTC